MGKVLLVVAIIAALVYGVLWLLERRRVGLSLWPGRNPRPRQVRIKAPDDDDDFLRSLRRRREEHDGD